MENSPDGEWLGSGPVRNLCKKLLEWSAGIQKNQTESSQNPEWKKSH